MPEWTNSIFILVLGAIIGSIATYIVSYRLELRKWRADAALLRKDEIYSPVFDELSSTIEALGSFKSWRRATSFIRRFREWEARRATSSALMLPRPLTEMFNSLSNLCVEYNEARADHDDRLKTQLPNRHIGVEDYVIAMLLAEKILVEPDAMNTVVLDYLKEQRSSLEGLDEYWAEDRLSNLTTLLVKSYEWQVLSRVHIAYTNKVHELHREVRGRIEGIVTRYQTPVKSL